ncbi:MAG: hypothetical protein JW857_08340 [Bacteroidales bacterium]|nr:hypothetical protein [Bacteroidales bacterium]
MKKVQFLLLILFATFSSQAQIQLKVKMKDLTWNEHYTFNYYNTFKMESFTKNKVLKRTSHTKIYYQDKDQNFLINLDNSIETIIDKENEVAVQIMGAGSSAFYNTAAFKYPEENDLKVLELIPAEETKEILGYTCKKYTYTYKKIFGEVWITDELELPNDVGVFRACKMTALFNTLSVPGFVMEMTTENEKGGMNLMKTISLNNPENYTVNLNGAEMNTAINKVSYYSF